MKDVKKPSKLQQEFNAKSAKPLFRSARCSYREFGIYKDGDSFAYKHPALATAVKTQSLDVLMSPKHPARKELSSALRALPEFSAYLKTTARSDFFFAAFSQSARKKGATAAHTGPKDIERFILERLQNQYAEPRASYEFVVEAGDKIIGYVELFDKKPLQSGLQFERGLFIDTLHQAHGYGKEAILALTDYAFKIVGVNQIFTMADPENFRSVNNITQNSGGVKIGEADSKYAHLNGGGEKRHLFHIYPEKFYEAVKAKGNDHFLMQKEDAPPPPPFSGKKQGGKGMMP